MLDKRRLIVGILTMALLLGAPVVEARVYSNKELRDIAVAAYENYDYLTAAMYLFAYTQRSPEWMTNEKQAALVHTALQYSMECARGGGSKGDISKPPPKLRSAPQETDPKPTRCLVCRGGGKIRLRLWGGTQPRLSFRFQRGSKAVGKQWQFAGALAPGECAFVGTPVSAGEPNRVVVTSPALDASDFDIAWTAEGRVVETQTSGSGYVGALQDPLALQAFHVYDDGGERLIAVRIGSRR
ncbi:hypothetical protein KAW64_10175 [bacterium]|nr:hypothetical protein [bacterium]